MSQRTYVLASSPEQARIFGDEWADAVGEVFWLGAPFQAEQLIKDDVVIAVPGWHLREANHAITATLERKGIRLTTLEDWQRPQIEEARAAAALLDHVNIPRRGPDQDYTLGDRIQLLAAFLGVELVEGGVVKAADTTPRIDFRDLDTCEPRPLTSPDSETTTERVADFFGLHQRRPYKRPVPAFAELIEVNRGPDGSTLTIDGEEFPWYIDEAGVRTQVERDACPSITLTILADEVRVKDSLKFSRVGDQRKR